MSDLELISHICYKTSDYNTHQTKPENLDRTSGCVFYETQLFTMFVASAAEGKIYNGFRSVDVSFIFRFGVSPSGSPVVENMKSYRFYKLFVDTRGAYFGGSLGHAVAVPGAHFALRNNTKTCKFY